MSVSLEDFIRQAQSTGILTEQTLVDFLPPRSDPKDAEELAGELVRRHKLTRFQADEICRGNGNSLVLGNYTILDKIGAGGMGQVFKAEHRRMRRIVAVKMLPGHLLQNEAVLSRFEREVTAAAKLDHPNIVTAFDADKTNGAHLLVMEYVEGKDLAALVRINGQFPVELAIDCVEQAAQGLEAAHAAGIVHRDIKPANLLLDKKGIVKVLDLGLARFQDDSGVQADLTHTGTVMGTVDYMAPEQALNTKSADGQADIYSLGCSLFFLLTGRPMYTGDTLMAKLLAHRDQPIPPLRDFRPDVPESLEVIYRRMVAKRPESRYATMAAVIHDLRACQAGGAISVDGGTSASAQVPSSVGNRDAGTAGADDPALQDFLSAVSPATSITSQQAKPESAPARRQRLVIAGLAGLLGVVGTWLWVNRQKESVRKSPLTGSVEAGKTLDSKPTESAAAKTPATPATRDRPAAEWVIANGGTVFLDDSSQEIRDSAFLPDRPFRLTKIHMPLTFHGIGLKDALRNLPHVTELALGGNLFGDSEAVGVAEMNRLTDVAFSRCPIGDDGLANLAGHSRLKSIGLYYALNVRDEGLRHLAGLTEVENLHLGGTQITDEGLKHLAELSRIKLLYADDTKLTGVGFRHLGKLKKVELLHLANAPITDDGVTAIVALTSLKHLNLDNTQITDASIDQLAKLAHLDTFIISSPRLSPGGIARLKAALPRATIRGP